MELASLTPLIGEARQRQRFRRRRQGLVLLIAAALAAGLIVALRPGPTAMPATTSPRPSASLPSWTVLSRSPYMGITCHKSCGSVGLAVWLTRPASSVRATIDGARLTLHRFGNPRIPGTEFAGYLRPGVIPGLGVDRGTGIVTWQGAGMPRPAVRLSIGEPDGLRAVTRMRVPVMAGWG